MREYATHAVHACMYKQNCAYAHVRSYICVVAVSTVCLFARIIATACSPCRLPWQS